MPYFREDLPPKVIEYRKSRTEAVTRSRQNTKIRLVAAMGGGCACCGYNRLNSALELHHINPEDKDPQIGRGGSFIDTKKLIVEAKKCILLCSLCHREVHAGLRELPSKIPIFDTEIFYNVINTNWTVIPTEPKSKTARESLERLKRGIEQKQKRAASNKKLLKLLDENNHNCSAVARILRISPNAVLKRRKKITNINTLET